MLSYEQALRIIEKSVRPLKPVQTQLGLAHGLRLARDIKAIFDMPQFDNSAMDGVGVRVADCAAASAKSPVVLKLDSVSRAGSGSRGRLKPGQAVRIFTGAPVPAGVDAVVMQEQCEFGTGTVTISKPPKPGENIRSRGEEYRKGDVLLKTGEFITPAVISLLASQGIARVPVHPLPRVAIVTSGDELVDPGQPLKAGQIYDSNGPGLVACCRRLGIEPVLRRVKDNTAAARRTVAKLLDTCDVLLIAGGVSVGDYDFNRDVLESLGVNRKYHMLAVKPGKPNYFGVYRRSKDAAVGAGQTYVFGLPGNPVSVLVSFEKLASVALARLGRQDWSGNELRLPLLQRITKKRGRLEWVRAVGVVPTGKALGGVVPVTLQGSHMLLGLVEAEFLITFPAELEVLEKGSLVEVSPIGW